MMDVHKKHNFLVSVHTGVRWVKPAWSAEPIFEVPALLMGTPRQAPASVV